MVLFRTLRRTPRTTSPSPTGTTSRRSSPELPPDDEVILDAPEECLAPVLVHAGRGEYEAAAKLLTSTREKADWELRDRVTLRLAAFARRRPEWFTAWQAASPHDPDLLLVKAQLALDQGWESPARAELLRATGPLITAAAEGDARDPVPWRLALDHARGTNESHTVFELLWEQALRRSPHHYGSHVAALRYLSAAWYGSHRECFDFAERAAQDAHHGSLLRALPARAALAYLTGPGPATGLSAVLAPERLHLAAGLGIELSATFPPHDPWPAEVRNVLVCVLAHLGRHDDALEQLRLIGPYACSFPWNHYAEDPLGHFLGVRAAVVTAQARGRAPLRKGERPGPDAARGAGR
ncbi:hypothetical protein HUT18_05700 [Streptomyces sp. NA04227]|uniref:hypothetical protein n=1 Tax=Streptomyces sp. NA04227 TaxID=2742136 RepID=UPI001591A04D|nr:hypothetical protein [Streptomyces sp. NA04227]QKW05964.1 hypothetical protein HUT18_05700 [Streptomyces sp. NA04227]